MLSNKKRNKNGYTMIEVTLAMSFVATLVIGIAVTFMQLSQLYNKGLTIKSVNSAIRTVSTDIKSSIAASQDNLSLISDGKKAKSLEQAANVSGTNERSTDYYNNEYGGRLCTGSNTYLWNYRKSIEDINNGIDHTNHHDNLGQFYIQKNAGGTEKKVPIRFSKVEDPNKSLCRLEIANELKGLDKKLYEEGVYIPDEFASRMTSVFGDGERGLAVYNFDISEPEALKYEDSRDDENRTRIYSTFYNIEITVGSSLFFDEYFGSSEDICGPGKDRDVYSEYCSINQIKFVALSGSANK